MTKLPSQNVVLMALLIANLTSVGVLIVRNEQGSAQLKQAEAELQAAQAGLQQGAADLDKAQADAKETLRAMRLCHDGVNELQPGETCFIKITAPMPGQKL